jgi:hypothetical protein
LFQALVGKTIRMPDLNQVAICLPHFALGTVVGKAEYPQGIQSVERQPKAHFLFVRGALSILAFPRRRQR